jgi:hypothetical protein
LEVWEFGDKVIVGINFLHWVPVLLPDPLDPEGATSLGRKVPMDDFTDVCVEVLFSFLNGMFECTHFFMG